jgi:hypothetical protein
MSKSLSQMAEDLADSTTVTLSSGTGTYSIGGNLTVNGGGYTYSNTAITNTGAVTGSPYTITGSNTAPYTLGAGTGITSPWATYTPTPKIKLDGEGADIEVNGWSLVDAIKKIEERLNILHPNTKLEEEWEELRALGDQYRKLEQHIKDKQATWDKLKAMPKID